MGMCERVCEICSVPASWIEVAWSAPVFYPLLLGLLLAYFIYYRLFKCAPLKLQYEPTELNKRIVELAPELQRSYSSTIYLPNGHLQTVFYAILRRWYNLKFGIDYERELVDLLDGGKLALDWPIFPDVDKNMNERTPVIALMAGLTGGRKDIYIATLMKDAAKLGYRTVLVNQRGCSNTKLYTARFYCGDSTDDAHCAFMAIKNKYPKNPLYAVGMSLGANIITNYMGKHGEKCILKGMVGICNPYDFYSLDQHMESHMFGIYHRTLGRHMVRLLSEHIEAMRPLERKMGYTLEEGISRVKNSRDFDNIFTSHVFDYHTAFNYYRKASSALWIDEVRKPALFISALDDPIVDSKLIPYRECQVNKHIILATHPCGGHLGFFTGVLPRQWMSEPTLGFIKALEQF